MKDHDYCPKSLALVAAGITAVGGILIGYFYGLSRNLGNYYPNKVEVGDFNNDDYLDVAVFSIDKPETPTNIFFGDETGILTPKEEHEKEVREKILLQIKEIGTTNLRLPLELNVKAKAGLEGR